MTNNVSGNTQRANLNVNSIIAYWHWTRLLDSALFYSWKIAIEITMRSSFIWAPLCAVYFPLNFFKVWLAVPSHYIQTAHVPTGKVLFTKIISSSEAPIKSSPMELPNVQCTINLRANYLLTYWRSYTSTYIQYQCVRTHFLVQYLPDENNHEPYYVYILYFQLFTIFRVRFVI